MVSVLVNFDNQNCQNAVGQAMIVRLVPKIHLTFGIELEQKKSEN